MKTQHRRTVMAIDDDEINLMILTKCASEAGYSVMAFESARAGMSHLRAHPGEVDIVLLDKMMPEMSGIDMLRQIKEDKEMQHLPVILQTGDVGISQMREGLECGAYYYLTKPFHPEILTAVLNSAAHECDMREELMKQAQSGQPDLMPMLHAGIYHIRSIAQARQLSAALSHQALYPEFAATGLMELMGNAIEHGNLGFTTEEKTELLAAGTWQKAVEDRLKEPAFAEIFAEVTVRRTGSGIQLHILDKGKGFNWKSFVYSDPLATSMTPAPVGAGRGISKAMIMLEEVQYHGDGNEVSCILPTAGLFN